MRKTSQLHRSWNRTNWFMILYTNSFTITHHNSFTRSYTNTFRIRESSLDMVRGWGWSPFWPSNGYCKMSYPQLQKCWLYDFVLPEINLPYLTNHGDGMNLEVRWWCIQWRLEAGMPDDATFNGYVPGSLHDDDKWWMYWWCQMVNIFYLMSNIYLQCRMCSQWWYPRKWSFQM